MEDRGSKIEDGGMSAGVLRLFVAISLPDSVKDEIEKAQRQLRDAFPGKLVRWTKREQFHLTLKFLGNVAESRVPELAAALRETCLNFAPLQLRAERIGFFPDIRFPRVVWAWVHDDRDREILLRLQKAIEEKVKGFTDERTEKAFRGHVTLGRTHGIKRSHAEVFAKLANDMSDRFFGEWTADSVELIRSELSTGGSQYTTLAAVPLSGKE
jgi:RNA 2',3'-cyclic 3'-phosphodiesterase